MARVEVDALDTAGCTPLHHATALGHDGVVMELWSKSANVDLADTNGWTGQHSPAPVPSLPKCIFLIAFLPIKPSKGHLQLSLCMVAITSVLV